MAAAVPGSPAASAGALMITDRSGDGDADDYSEMPELVADNDDTELPDLDSVGELLVKNPNVSVDRKASGTSAMPADALNKLCRHPKRASRLRNHPTNAANPVNVQRHIPAAFSLC